MSDAYFCDCEDCFEDPCSMDCDLDDACIGCREAKIEAAEAEFEAAKAQGLV